MNPNWSISHSPRRETSPPPVQINNVCLAQQDNGNYLELHLNRRLAWLKHISKTETDGNDAH
jgi:hypothetical protein